MGDQKTIQIPSAPALVDHVCLQNCQLQLPCAPEVWHRPGQRQPCTMSLKLSCSSIAASAADDEVSFSLDYGKLYRLIESHLAQRAAVQEESGAGKLALVGLGGQRRDNNTSAIDHGQDVSLVGGEIACLALGFLRQQAMAINAMKPDAIQCDFGQCEISLRLPNSLLRSEHGLVYRGLGYIGRDIEGETVTVMVEEEFQIPGIRCHCIIGINPHERLEKQAVIVSLGFKTGGQDESRNRFLETYQEMTRVVAEV